MLDLITNLQPQADAAGGAGVELVVSALIVNPERQIFVQKRSLERKLFPGCWDIVGGHVEAGETLDAALQREITEETGWTLKNVLGFVDAYEWGGPGTDYAPHKEFMFLAEGEGDLGNPRLEPGKVTEFRWITAAETDILHENREPLEEVSCHRMVTDGFKALDTLP